MKHNKRKTSNLKKLIAEHNPKIGKYTITDNEILFRKPPIPPVAGFFFLKLLSLPPNWNLTVNNLAKTCGVGTTMVQTAFNTLRTYGYLDWRDTTDEIGHFKRVYTLKEKCNGELFEQTSKNNDATIDYPERIPRNGSSTTDNQELYINNNNINTKDINTNLYKFNNKKKSTKEVVTNKNCLDVKEYIDSLDIDSKLKIALKKHVQMRISSGLSTTVQIYKEIYTDLVVECSSLEQQINRVYYAVKKKYPTFSKNNKAVKLLKNNQVKQGKEYEIASDENGNPLSFR